MVFGKMIVLDVLIKLIVDMEPSEKLMWISQNCSFSLQFAYKHYNHYLPQNVKF